MEPQPHPSTRYSHMPPDLRPDAVRVDAAVQSTSITTSTTLTIRLLDTFSVQVGPRIIDDAEWKVRKAKSVIKMLALAPGHRLHRAEMMDLLWPDMDMDSAVNNLHKMLYIARHVLEPGLSVKSSSQYIRLHNDFVFLLAGSGLWIDVLEFRRMAQAARELRDIGLYEQALALYVGPLLPEDRYADWAIRDRESLSELHENLLAELAALYQERGDREAAIDCLRRIIELDPANEEAHADLMRFLVETGQRHTALRQFEHLREALERELDVEPDESTLALYEAIRHGSSVPLLRMEASPPTLASHRSIEIGAQPVGREQEMDTFSRLLDESVLGRGTFAVLSGATGMGKSVLARALTQMALSRGVATTWLDLGATSESTAPRALSDVLDRVAALRGSIPAGWPGPTGNGGVTDGRYPPTPLVVVIDNLQDADRVSLSQLGEFVGAHSRAPVLVVGLLRSDVSGSLVLSDLLAVLESTGAMHCINLQPLQYDDSALLMAQVLDGDVDSQLVHAVHALAAGCPGVIVDTVRLLRKRGEVGYLRGRWRLSSDVPAELSGALGHESQFTSPAPSAPYVHGVEVA